jgi:DNA-binding GntR family transcriptional regulator
MDPRGMTYRRIRGKLLDGTVRSRRDLSRRRLAASLKVNPSHVQWALMRMEAEGLLESRPQSGTFIRRLTPEEFRNLHDIRELIEPYAAARAARMITPELLARLEQVVQETASYPDDLAAVKGDQVPARLVERIIRLETAFHGAILEAAQNPEALRIVEHAQIFTHLTRYFPSVSRAALIADARATLAGHRAILAALRTGNAKLARRLMKEHLTKGFTTVYLQPPRHAHSTSFSLRK